MLAALILSILAGRSLFKALSVPDVPSNPTVIAVDGDIRKPGNYLLEGPEVTVSRAVEAAGGLRNGVTGSVSAEMTARPVRSGQVVHLQASAQGPVVIGIEAMSAAVRLALGEKLNVNASSEEELMLVPQMKAGFAAAIVNQRRQACWRSLAELERIPGVGPKTVEKWQPYLEAADCGMGGKNEKKQ